MSVGKQGQAGKAYRRDQVESGREGVEESGSSDDRCEMKSIPEVRAIASQQGHNTST
jgi:hypothetical protein